MLSELRPLNGQLRIIAAHLVTHGTITGLEALRCYGVYRLAAVIEKLRRRGLSIVTERADGGSRHASYRLADKGSAIDLLAGEEEC